jgi:hypothetical protein
MEGQKVQWPASLVIPIVGDAALAGPIADGRLIPVLILDRSARPGLGEAIRIHEHLPPGDVQFRGAVSRESYDEVVLYVRLVQPMEVEFLLRFSIERQAVLVEAMLKAGAVYLQVGSAADRLSTTMDAPRILIELTDTGFKPTWDKVALDRMTTVMAKRLGVPKRRARVTAELLMAELDRATSLRLRPLRTDSGAAD